MRLDAQETGRADAGRTAYQSTQAVPIDLGLEAIFAQNGDPAESDSSSAQELQSLNNGQRSPAHGFASGRERDPVHAVEQGYLGKLLE